METVENILAIIGLISLVLTVIRMFWIFFGSGMEWIDNVKIIENPCNENDEHIESVSSIYPTYFKDEDEDDAGERTEFATPTMITPQSTIIRNLKIKRLVGASIATDKLKYRTIKTIKTITPQHPLCIVCERSETFAKYCIEWRIDYGGKASYYFSDNMRDGNNNRIGVEYSFGCFSKIRKLLDLK